MKPSLCPALFLTAPSSGQGKTTVTAILARWFSRQGKTVRIFKTGPDYLDPQILEQACGHPVEQLDLWMCGEAYCRQRLYLASQQADLILIEGAMGMYDGNPSSADLAATFGIPLALLMDVSGMAQTAAALAYGLAGYRDDIQVAGLIANRCGSDYHRNLIDAALPDTLPLLFALQRDEDISLPERHLGLVQASEITQQLEQKLNHGADKLAALNPDDFLQQCGVVEFQPQTQQQPPALLRNQRIAIARDAAFSFIYRANLELLQQMGAELLFFSPLHDQQLPDADALWLPGGYPELHLEQLSQNQTMLDAIRDFFNANKPILAECGGFLYCLEQLQPLHGDGVRLLGLLTGEGIMRDRGGCQGMQTAPLPEGDIRGHSHHRSATRSSEQPLIFAKRARHPAPGEAIYRRKQLTAGYLHLFFPSNPQAVAQIFSKTHDLV